MGVARHQQSAPSLLKRRFSCLVRRRRRTTASSIYLCFVELFVKIFTDLAVLTPQHPSCEDLFFLLIYFSGSGTNKKSTRRIEPYLCYDRGLLVVVVRLFTFSSER